MFALPNLHVLLAPLLLAALIGLTLTIVFVVIRTASSHEGAASAPSPHGESEARKCQYCRRGAALLREETVRLDGDDLVDVRCYVCATCGLPQWWVERRGISPHVH